MIAIDVSEADIREGIAGDCDRCAVALAIARALPGSCPSIHENFWTLRIDLDGRSIVAPFEARMFVLRYDGMDRLVDGRVDPASEDPPGPFRFELPDLDDPAWQASCYDCEDYYQPEELDDEGVCPICREMDAEEGGGG